MSMHKFAAPCSFRFARNLGLVLLLSAPSAALTLACGAQSADGLSTNTGNPPVLDDDKISIERVADGVRVVGEAGAVSPGPAQVQVTNLDSKESVEVQAASDGSFDAEIAGTTEDRYEVVAEADGAKASTQLQPVESDSSDHECLQSLGLSVDANVCSSSTSEAMCRLERGWEAAAECETNEDCIEVPATVRCIRSCDSAVIVNQAQSESFAEAVSDSNAACDGFDSGGCMFPPGGPCAIAAPRTPACLEGKCAAVAGCNTTAQSGSASIADARPQLAVGCSADEQCTVQSIASANWECPEQVFVSDASRASYDQLLYELNMRSTATDGADSCRGPSCEPLATPELTCEEGTCVVKKVTREEIQVQIDALNHCEVTADCEAVSIAPCGTEYIAKGSDRSELDALLSEYIKLIGPVGCDGSCACGLLECVEQRCTTRASDCMEMPEGTTNVCL